MKKLAIALMLCLSAATGFSQCTTNRVSARKEMHMASAVFVGTVTAAQPVPEGLSGWSELHRSCRLQDPRQGATEH